jgi:hypothetical protein
MRPGIWVGTRPLLRSKAHLCDGMWVFQRNGLLETCSHSSIGALDLSKAEQFTRGVGRVACDLVLNRVNISHDGLQLFFQ